MDAPTRHDYARIWRRLDPRARDRRISQALERVAAGETLAEVGQLVGLSESGLCQALLAYAPTVWRQALVAREMVRTDRAAELADHAARADLAQWQAASRHWAACRLRLDRLLAGTWGRAARRQGREVLVPCPACNGQASLAVGRPAQCYACGWSAAVSLVSLSANRKATRLPEPLASCRAA